MLNQQRFVCRTFSVAVLLHVALSMPNAFAQTQFSTPALTNNLTSNNDNSPIEPTGDLDEESAKQGDKLRFSFDRTSWREVFSWLADEAGLALHIAELPSGTFSYSDPTEYTTTSAIDRINMFLLPDGFTLVRSTGLLSVINLRDARSLQRLDVMARVVAADELEKLDDNEVVKCFFPLNELRSSDATGELIRLQLMTPPIALEASKQLAVIETARKLRSVKAVIAAMDKEMSNKKSLVLPFALKHVDLETLLTVARPHLNIEPGLTRGTEINISCDETGKKLFVSGTREALQLLESLIAVVDVPDASQPAAIETQVLRSHRVRDQNLTTVFDVLQTVLISKSIRISMEPSTNSIVALADEDVHKIIESTITELEGQENVFVIIPLQSIDPYFTITLLEEMFELKLPANLLSKKAIKVDADPAGMRLFVRGPKDKVDEIQKVIEDLDQKDSKGTERIVPVFGAKAKSLLEQAESSWQGKNPIRQLDTSYRIETEIIERSIHKNGLEIVEPKDRPNQESKIEFKSRPDSKNQSIRKSELVSAKNEVNATNESRAIEAKITSRGIILGSDDSAALDSFESHLRSLSDSDGSSKVETIIYYLKYCDADEATQLVADLLDGTSSVVENSTQAKLVKGTVPTTKSPTVSTSERRSTKDGSTNDGSTLVTSGSLTIIADARLNRLICVGNSSDLKLVEQYLAVIDKDTSLTAIEIHGVSHIVELKHARASEIAAVIRDTYGDRVAMSSEQKKAQQAESAADKERGQAGPENKIQTSRNQKPQMSIAVHEVSNSLIVTAPETLYQDIKELVDRLDQQSEQAVEVVYYPSAEGIEMLRSALQLKGSPIKPRATSTTTAKPR